MFVLLLDTETSYRKGLYLHTEVYNEAVERLLVELYYRDIAEGLVEHASVEKREEFEVKDLREWVTVKLQETTESNASAALQNLLELI